MVHWYDLEGTKQRISVASKHVPRFSISSECGLGRRSEEIFRDVIAIEAEVAEPVR